MTETSWLAPVHLLATLGTKVVVFNHLTGQARTIDDGLYAKLYSPNGNAFHGTTPDALNRADLRKAEEAHLQPDSPPAAFKLLRMPAANGRIGVTAFGIVGDCGMGSRHNYVGIGDNDLARLIAAGPSYRRLIRSRWVARAAPCLVINGGGFLMGAAIGVDNTSVLPPFVPLWRNSDGLFAQCLLACADDVYLGFLPKVVQHLPPSRRAGRTGSAQQAASIGVSQVLSYLTRGYPGRHAQASTVDKLKGLGDYLQSIGSQSTDHRLPTSMRKRQYLRRN